MLSDNIDCSILASKKSLSRCNELLLLSPLISHEFVCYSREFVYYSRDCHVVAVVFETMDEDSLEADEGNSEEEYSDSESLEILSSSSALHSQTELLPLQGHVWQYFGFPVRDGRFVEPDKKNEPRFIENCAQRY